MPSTPVEVPSQDAVSDETRSGTIEAKGRTVEAKGLLGWSSFFFALLQSICTFFIAVSGLRLVIGIGSLAMSAGVVGALDRFHTDWIRVPMMALALVGAVVNLAVLAQIRYLRRRPASRWRTKPPSPHTLRMERLQFALSIAALFLIGLEEYFHLGLNHTL
jgi:hypothetical protein